MTFSKFLRAVGAVAAVAINTAAVAKVQENNRNAAVASEVMEEQKWEKRKQEALESITNGLSNDGGMMASNGMTFKQRKAIQLADEVKKHCRNRSESMMSYTERCILQFQLSRY